LIATRWKEDDRHGVLEHRERKRAEKEHGHEEDTTHHLAVGQKGPQFVDQGAGLTWHDTLEILPQSAEKLVLTEHMRERQQG
jgi:hypothetical protein